MENISNSSAEPERDSKVIFMDEFDESRVKKEYEDFFRDLPKEDEKSRLYVYTPSHIGSENRMGFFGDFAPSIIYSVNNHHDTDFPFRQRNLFEFAYSKLSHLYCTLDRSIMFGYYNRHSALSKVYNLNSVATILNRSELKIDEEKLEDKDISSEEILNFLFQVKRNSTKLIKEVKTDYNEVQNLRPSEHSLQYPSIFRKILGRNLSGILLYGSSAVGEGSDFDNIISIKSLPLDLYERIKGISPRENGKDVGAIFVPENILTQFLYINVGNTIFRNKSKSLESEFNFPIESERYRVWKEMYHSGVGSGKLIGGMNLVFRNPEILYGKSGLFDYFMKLNRFTLSGILQKEGYEVKSKEEVLDLLKTDFDFEIPAFRPDGEYLKESFLKANKVSVEIAKRIYDPSLAQEDNEHLIKITRKHNNKILEGTHKGTKIYVFSGREEIKEGNVVPVKVLKIKDPGYDAKKREIFHRGIDSGKKYYVGKRL